MKSPLSAISAGAYYLSGDIAWLDFAATKPEYREKGAQSALLARRIDDAAAEGCRLFVVETAEQTPEKEAPSFRNMRRYGFEVAYTRPNYIMKF